MMLLSSLKKKIYLHYLLHVANWIWPSIQFTIKYESNWRLHMLDTYNERKDDDKIQSISTSFYRKPTSYGQYFNF